MSTSVAVIGTGQIARQHLACLRELPQVSVLAVCDLSRAMAEAAADRFGVARWFTDHRRMLDEIRPDAVHVTTPPATHRRLAQDALEAGAHVIVEKPACERYEEVKELIEHAQRRQRSLLEDYNYVFNDGIQRALGMIGSAQLGEVVHVDVMLTLDLVADQDPLVDRHLPHPSLSMEGGAIGEFLPHLASLAHAFVGPHRSVRSAWTKRNSESPLPHDDLRALVVGENDRTAAIAFSANSRPDTFTVRVHGTRGRATIGLFEPKFVVESARNVPRPLIPLLNGLSESRIAGRAAIGGLWRKLKGGPGSYHGMWELLRRAHQAIHAGAEPPVSLQQIDEVNRLVADLKKKEFRL